ncbi:hypothetical protein [Acinetobacter bereziniae]|uniref:hypothetical protein n=1 Tax=Acinetobacter bereziniae TaxID=106648 RepID=UPI00124FC87F|nr:hypothetical protein [Acinetobacter bereziniae]MBJ8551561.1 hypothetical protein [Acinetobacter bereziniae]
MKKYLYTSTFVSIAFSIAGCQSVDTRPANLDQYLQQFIGKSSAEIQAELNFKALGYQVSDHIQTTNDTLTYTILRPINIPMTGSNATVGSNAMGMPVIRYDTASTPSYDVNFNCKVSFKLNNDIAESVEYIGRAC